MNFMLKLAMLWAIPSFAMAASEKHSIDFRNQFLTQAIVDMGLRVGQHAIFFPPPSVLNIPLQKTPEATILAYQQSLQPIRPLDLYYEGIDQPFEVQDNQPPLEPMTMILFPGFLQEFFGDYLADLCVDSHFAKEFQTRFDEAIDASKIDHRYSVKDQGQIKAPLNELVKAFSLDDELGQPLVRIIYLKPIFGSMESFSSMDDVVPAYLRRLDKVFKIIPIPDRLFLAGHSMGVMRASHALSTIHKSNAKPAWYESLKGIVSFNGAIWGSSMADAQDTKGTLVHALVEAGEQLLKMPESPTLGKTRAQIIAAQAVSLLAAVGIMTERVINEPKIQGELDISYLEKLGNKILHEVGLSVKDIPTIIKSAFSWKDQGSPITPKVTRRIKDFISCIFKAMNELTLSSRIDWFRNHILPTNIPYYSIASTLPGPPTPDHFADSHDLSERGFYNMRTMDYRAMRIFYYDSFAIDQVLIQDGLVGLHKARWLPELHQLANPNQDPYEEKFLGILGSTHINILLGEMFPSEQERAEGFPRHLLLKSLHRYLNAQP